MPPLEFANFRLLTFDCYGTLIDWETGIFSALRPVLAAHGQQISDSALLELYGELEAQAEAGEYAIRTAGLAAESLVYNESFDDLMRNPAVLRSVKTDMDNAKLDLKKGGLLPANEQEFVCDYWRVGFYDASEVLKRGQGKLECIADHCFGNLDRTILKAELVEKCQL